MEKQGKAIKKISGGKLLRVDVTYSTHIQKVKVTGDFFLDPEDTLEEIEACLAGVRIPLQKEELAARLQEMLEQEQATLIGFTPMDLVEILEEALK